MFTSSRRTCGVTVLFFDDVLEGLVREGQLGVHLLQLAVLGLELFQSPKLRYVQTAVLRLPVVERRLADAVLSDKLRHLHAGLCLLQDRDDLLFTEPGLLHKSSPVGKLYSRLVRFGRGLHRPLRFGQRPALSRGTLASPTTLHLLQEPDDLLVRKSRFQRCRSHNRRLPPKRGSVGCRGFPLLKGPYRADAS
jgi:hypothetical protein